MQNLLVNGIGHIEIAIENYKKCYVYILFMTKYIC